MYICLSFIKQRSKKTTMTHVFNQIDESLTCINENTSFQAYLKSTRTRGAQAQFIIIINIII